MIRLRLGQYLNDLGRSLAEADGGQLVVEVTDHRLLTSMERPDTDRRAWDPDLFVSGQMYMRGYANPIKPVVERTEDMEEMDEAELEAHPLDDDDAAEADGGEDVSDHAKLLSSWRYKEYQDQHLITELVRPEEQWKMIIYVLLGIAGLVVITLFVNLWGTFA